METPSLLSLFPTLGDLNKAHARNREEARLLRRLDNLTAQALVALSPKLEPPLNGEANGTVATEPPKS